MTKLRCFEETLIGSLVIVTAVWLRTLFFWDMTFDDDGTLFLRKVGNRPIVHRPNKKCIHRGPESGLIVGIACHHSSQNFILPRLCQVLRIGSSINRRIILAVPI